MLASDKLIAFIATADASKARMFYGETLGLKLIADENHALVFDAAGTQLRIQKVPVVEPPPFTGLGWQVQDIAEVVATLSARGVQLQHFEGLPQDDRGVWVAEDGTKVAWFKDPDSNLLSLTEFPR